MYTTESTDEPSIKKTKESTALDVGVDELRATYKTQPPPAQNDWPNYRITKYVRLAIVEKPEKTYRADHEHHNYWNAGIKRWSRQDPRGEETSKL